MITETLELLSELTRRGVELRPYKAGILYRPREAVTPELIERIRESKVELRMVLAGPGVWAQAAAGILATVEDDDLRADLRYLFEERAGICEYEGNMKRDDAERIGYECLLRAMTEAGILAGGGHGEKVA